MRSAIKTREKEFDISPNGISFDEFKDWLANNPSAEFLNVIVRRKSKKTTLRYLGLNHDHIINAEEADLILDAYNELLAENRINENNELNFKKFIVDRQKYIGRLTKEQFRNLIKLGVSRFRNIEILDHSPQPFHFSSLALNCGMRAKVNKNGSLVIPDNAVLTTDEWKTLQNRPISFSFGSNVTVVARRQSVESAPANIQLEIKNHDFERTYKTRSLYIFDKYTVTGPVDLSTTIQKTPCRSFNIQNTTFTGSVNLCNAVFNKSETSGANLNGGIIFNHNTDFSKWNGNVKMLGNAQIVYTNKEGKKIRTTVDKLYAALKKEYSDSRAGIFSILKSDFIKNSLEATDKFGKPLFETNGEKLFKLLQHMQEQKKNWFFHRTLNVFNTVINLLEKPQQAQQPIPQQPISDDPAKAEGAPVLAANQNAQVVAPVSEPEHWAAAPARSGTPDSSASNVSKAGTAVVERSKTPPKKLTKEESCRLVAEYCENTWYALALNHIRKNSNILVREEIEKLILTIKNAMHTNILTYKALATVEPLSDFLNSDFAKNEKNMSKEFYGEITRFVKAMSLSIELTQSLVNLKYRPGEFHAVELAKLFYLANQAKTSGFKSLHWVHYESCDRFKTSAKEDGSLVRQSLANILPDGKVNTINRLINTNAIQNYILTALGLMSHTIHIGNAVNNFLKLAAFSSMRNKDEQITPSTRESTPLHKLLYNLQEVKNKMMGKEMHDPTLLLDGMREIVEKLKPTKDKKISLSIGLVEEAINAATKECGAKLENFSKELKKQAQQSVNQQSLNRARHATEIAPQAALLPYADVEVLLNDTIWNDILVKWTKNLPKNSSDTNMSLSERLMIEIGETIDAVLKNCRNSDLTDDDRLIELRNVYLVFNEIVTSQSEINDTSFYTDIKTAWEAIHQKMQEIEKKEGELSDTTSSTSRHSMFGGSAAAAAAAAAATTDGTATNTQLTERNKPPTH